MRTDCFLRIVLALGLAVLGGCNPGGAKPPLGKVRGTVTNNGQPLTTGSVTFIPIQGKGGDTGQIAIGEIESDGTFELTTFNTGDGALVGQHKAIVVASLPAANAPTTTGEGGMMPMFAGPKAYVPPKPLVNPKYSKAETTPLMYTVEAGGNTFEITLKD